MSARFVKLLVISVLALLGAAALVAAAVAPSAVWGLFDRTGHANAAPGAAGPATSQTPTASAVPTASAQVKGPRISPELAAALQRQARHLDSLDLLRYVGGGIIGRGDPRTGMVAITFDDGPSPNTEALLDILRKGKVHATFMFVAGRTVGREGAVRDAFAQGNEIANHTWTHATLRPISPAIFEYQVMQGQRLFSTELDGYAPRLVRPRGGKADADTVHLAQALGDNMLVVDWTITGCDTDFSKTPREIADKVLADVQPGDIILLHETNLRTVDALAMIVSGIKGRGLKPVTVSELLAASKTVQYIPYSAREIRIPSLDDPVGIMVDRSAATRPAAPVAIVKRSRPPSPPSHTSTPVIAPPATPSRPTTVAPTKPRRR